MRKTLSLLITALGLSVASISNAATTTWFLDNTNSGGKTQGLTYVLDGTLVDSDTWNFLLTVYGANTAADTKGGRTFLEDIAFGKPTGFISTVPTSIAGGLSSGGCNGSGNFFCFDGAHVAAASVMSFAFSVDATGIGSWAPDIKVDWLGSANNYDLISLGMQVGTCIRDNCGGQEVPEPASLALLGAGLTGLALVRRRRRA